MAGLTPCTHGWSGAATRRECEVAAMQAAVSIALFLYFSQDIDSPRAVDIQAWTWRHELGMAKRLWKTHFFFSKILGSSVLWFWIIVVQETSGVPCEGASHPPGFSCHTQTVFFYVCFHHWPGLPATDREDPSVLHGIFVLSHVNLTIPGELLLYRCWVVQQGETLTGSSQSQATHNLLRA